MGTSTRAARQLCISAKAGSWRLAEHLEEDGQINEIREKDRCMNARFEESGHITEHSEEDWYMNESREADGYIHREEDGYR